MLDEKLSGFAAAAPIIGGGLSALGGIFGGNGQSAAEKAQLKEQQRQFGLSNWQGAAHGLETSGLRDKLLAIMGQSATQGFQPFQPRDAFNPQRGAPGSAPTALAHGQMGGPMPGSLNLPSNYKMGDGGVNPDVYSYLMHQLGYRPPDDVARMKEDAHQEETRKKYMQSLQPQPQQQRPGFDPRNPMGGGLVNPSGRSY